MPITLSPPPLFKQLLPFIHLANEFESAPPALVPVTRLVTLISTFIFRILFCQFSNAIRSPQVTSFLIPKLQDLMKGQPKDATNDAFVNHVIDFFTAMKQKVNKDVRTKLPQRSSLQPRVNLELTSNSGC